MEMTPPTCARSASDAEQRVFSLLEQTDLGQHARAYHSLNISEHEYKLVGEIDFVLLLPEGLYVLEVKGGGVALRNGLWEFTDRYGRTHKKSEGPFRQGRSAMFSLRARLSDDLPKAVTEGLVYGHGVVFPNIAFEQQSPEWTQAMVIDVDACTGAQDIREPLLRLIDYWRAKTPRAELVPPSKLKQIGGYLRPEFDKVPSLRCRVADICTTMEQLTEQQYEKLDLVEQTDRLICAGGAGTGKTFLAVEIARRDASGGSRVLITCRSPLLAAFIAQRVSDPLITVLPLDELPQKNEPICDVLIVDEAQDILDLAALDQLNPILEGGLEHGRWRFFYDVNNQSALFGDYDPDALEYLKTLATAGGAVDRNCRNTRSIVLQTQLLTHADLGNPMAGAGLPVEWVSYTGPTDEATLLEAHLRSLLDEDVAPGNITILSPQAYDDSCVARLRTKWRNRIVALDETAMTKWPIDSISFATITDFKGLENDFIVLVDVASTINEGFTRNLLYVAMSRARAGLWVALDRRVEAAFERARRENLDDVLQGAGGAPG